MTENEYQKEIIALREELVKANEATERMRELNVHLQKMLTSLLKENYPVKFTSDNGKITAEGLTKLVNKINELQKGEQDND